MHMPLEELKAACMSSRSFKKKKKLMKRGCARQYTRQLTEHLESSIESLGVGGVAEGEGLLRGKGLVSMFPLFPQTTLPVLAIICSRDMLHVFASVQFADPL